MRFWCGYTSRNGGNNVNGGRKYLFSKKGVDLSDDTAIEKFAHEVWEAFMKENGEENSDDADEN